MINQTDDIRIIGLRPLVSPALVMEEYAITEKAIETITTARAHGSQIMHGKDDRLLVIVGPCSIHDPDAALEYANNLKKLHDELIDDLLIVMRIYFEKPRTTVGWKGLINDPDLDGSFDINKGLRKARHLLLEVANIGLPGGTELLDTIVPQYISDLVSWGAIGARTTESQVHRELASGLSMPIGFKNGTNGNIQIAIDAIKAAINPHHFLSVTKYGLAAIVSTSGNDSGHVILRGASSKPNYDQETIAHTVAKLKDAQLSPNLMVDCSHGNSNKDYRRQPIVADDLCGQLKEGQTAISGVMLESNLVAGNQMLENKDDLVYGQSITDACIDWEETDKVLRQLAKAVQSRRQVSRL